MKTLPISLLAALALLPASGVAQVEPGCSEKVMAMNEIARGWQQRAQAMEAELTKVRAQLEQARFDQAMKGQQPASSASIDAAPAVSAVLPSQAKTEHVSGYTRKDGTVVQSYDRKPRSR